MINFNVKPRPRRRAEVFYLARHRTNYGKHEPITRMLREVNAHWDSFDVEDSKRTLKLKLSVVRL